MFFICSFYTNVYTQNDFRTIMIEDHIFSDGAHKVSAADIDNDSNIDVIGNIDILTVNTNSFNYYMNSGSRTFVNTAFIEDVEPLNSIAYVVKPISCIGDEGATIQVIAEGGTMPYQYELLDENNNVLISGQASNNFNIMNEGIYIIRVRDNEDETFENYVSIQEPLPLEADILVTDVTNNEANDGRIEISVNQGSEPYLYSLNEGSLTYNNVFSNLAPGSYSVYVIDSNDCEKTISATISETEILSTSSNMKSSGLYLYPNPLERGDVTIILEDNSVSDIHWFLYSSDGRQILSKTAKVVNNALKINMDGLYSGMYYLRVKTYYQTYNLKIIKK